MVDLPSSPLADIDPEFEKMALETGGLTYQLTVVTRARLCRVPETVTNPSQAG